jgi:hypothetical protein
MKIKELDSAYAYLLGVVTEENGNLKVDVSTGGDNAVVMSLIAELIIRIGEVNNQPSGAVIEMLVEMIKRVESVDGKSVNVKYYVERERR